MENNLIDLRWWLLSHIASINYLPQLYNLLVITIFLSFIFLSLSPILLEKNQTSHIKRFLLSDKIFVISLVVFILATRWPGFLPPMLNPDEAQFIAGAMKLLKDPVFWRAADVGSSGPLNIYPLTLPALLGFRLEYASSRVVGLILIILSVICLYYSLRFIYGNTLSRLSTIPLVTTVALMTAADYVHYSSEHVSIALLSVLLLIVSNSYSRSLNIPNKLVFLCGFIIGLIPFAKMQAVPIAFSISCIFLHILWLKSRTKKQFLISLYYFLIGTMLFPFMVLLYIIIFSVHDEFWKSYIQQNLLFYGSKIKLSLLRKIRLFLWMIRTNRNTKTLFTLTGITLILGLPILIVRACYLKYNKKQSGTFIFIYYSLAFLVASVFSGVQPGNPFPHYLLFLIIPSGFVFGALLGELKKVLRFAKFNQSFKMSLMTVFIVIIVASSFFQISRSVNAGNPYIANRRVFADNYISPVAKSILKHASGSESMAVWGWAAQLNVETGLIQATRDGDSVWQIVANPLQQYFLKRFVDDLLLSKPQLFVDAVAPGMFGFPDRKTQGHEAFPEIAGVVSPNYKLADEVKGVRIYVKKSSNWTSVQ